MQIKTSDVQGQEASESRMNNQPHPLPMPAYGGYYAPLSELLPNCPLPNPPYQRLFLTHVEFSLLTLLSFSDVF